MACSPNPLVSIAAAAVARAAEAEARRSEVARLIADIAEPEPAAETDATDLPRDFRAALFAWKASRRLAH